MANNDRQVASTDIKGDLAQRLRCPGCTRAFAQIEGRNKVELDRKETIQGGRRAITFVCDECKENKREPAYAFRMVGGLVQEIPVGDLPDLAAKAEPGVRRGTTKRTGGRRTRATRGTKKSTRVTTPTESPTAEGAKAASNPIAPRVEE